MPTKKKEKKNPPTRNEVSRRARHATKMDAIYEITFLEVTAIAPACCSHMLASLPPDASPLLQQILDFSSSAPIQISLFPIKIIVPRASRQLL